MNSRFFYGTLRHRPLLNVVLGSASDTLDIRPAHFDGYATYWVDGKNYPMIQPEVEGRAAGLWVSDLTAEDIARLDFYEGGHEYTPQVVTVQTDQGGRQAVAYLPPVPGPKRGLPWDLGDWAERWGALNVMAARDVMSNYGHTSPEDIARRYPSILARAASRRRAEQGGPATLRRATGPGDVEIIETRQPYANFFSVEEYRLRHRRFDGAMSAPLDRAAFVSVDAATVLPYDPQRDSVLLIEQFRVGPMARGDAQCWSLEAIAGRIDAGETPEETLRREAMEEAGLEIGTLFHVHSYYPTPGAKSEFIYSYVALADLPDNANGLGGLMHEGEDIRAHVVTLDRVQALMANGEIENAPLVISVLWLLQNRERLRAGA